MNCTRCERAIVVEGAEPGYCDDCALTCAWCGRAYVLGIGCAACSEPGGYRCEQGHQVALEPGAALPSWCSCGASIVCVLKRFREGHPLREYLAERNTAP